MIVKFKTLPKSKIVKANIIIFLLSLQKKDEQMKKLIASITFQIGVNVIGLPIFHTHDLRKTIISISLFHK